MPFLPRIVSEFFQEIEETRRIKSDLIDLFDFLRSYT